MSIFLKRPVLGLFVITLILGLGCASGAAVPVEVPTETSPSAVVSALSESVPEQKMVPVGVNVGDRAPDFAILLADGTTITSQELARQGKPAFLMFFATW